MIKGTVVSVNNDVFFTDNPLWMGPFESPYSVKLGDKVYYNFEIRQWIVALSKESK